VAEQTTIRTSKLLNMAEVTTSVAQPVEDARTKKRKKKAEWADRINAVFRIATGSSAKSGGLASPRSTSSEGVLSDCTSWNEERDIEWIDGRVQRLWAQLPGLEDGNRENHLDLTDLAEVAKELDKEAGKNSQLIHYTRARGKRMDDDLNEMRKTALELVDQNARLKAEYTRLQQELDEKEHQEERLQPRPPPPAPREERTGRSMDVTDVVSWFSGVTDDHEGRSLHRSDSRNSSVGVKGEYRWFDNEESRENPDSERKSMSSGQGARYSSTSSRQGTVQQRRPSASSVRPTNAGLPELEPSFPRPHGPAS